MFIWWVVYQTEVTLVYLDMTQILLKQRSVFFIKYKWLEWFPLMIPGDFWTYEQIKCNVIFN